MNVQTPSHPERREGQQVIEHRRPESEDGADLDECRLTHDRAAASAGDLPCGVRTVAMGRLGQLQIEPLGQIEEVVQKARG